MKKKLYDILPRCAGRKRPDTLMMGIQIFLEIYEYYTIINMRNINMHSFILGDITPGEPLHIDEMRFETKIVDLRYLSNEYLKTGEWVNQRDSIFLASALLYHLITGQVPWGINEDVNKLTPKKRIKAMLKEREEKSLDMSIVPPCFTSVIEYGMTCRDEDKQFVILMKKYFDAIYEALHNPNMKEWMNNDVHKGMLEELNNVLRDAVFKEETGAEIIDSEAIEDAPNSTSVPNEQSAYETQKTLYARTGVLGTFDFKQGNVDNGLNKVAGMEALKENLKKEVIFPLTHPEIAKRYKVHIANGLILYGPPGCGKSFFAEKFANSAGMSYCIIKASEISSSYIHGNQLLIQQLFDQAKNHAPSLIVLDEIDAMCPQRRDEDMKIASETNAFLSELNNLGESRVFVIGTTNKPHLIDSAVLRTGRFDKKVYIPFPDIEARKAIFEIELKGRPLDKDIDCDELAKKSENFTASDISAAVNTASLEAALHEELISQTLLLSHIAKTPPSLSEETKREYELIRKKMETRNTFKHNHIGFC